jgi:hypothetical protein
MMMLFAWINKYHASSKSSMERNDIGPNDVPRKLRARQASLGKHHPILTSSTSRLHAFVRKRALNTFLLSVTLQFLTHRAGEHNHTRGVPHVECYLAAKQDERHVQAKHT